MPFTLPIRIYYEDTDAGGVVYYANYLKFIERCRTEWLRSAGFDQSDLLRDHQLAFVVRRVEADYLRPAILDDRLDVTLAIEKMGAAQIVFAQSLVRHGSTKDSEDTEDTGSAETLFTARVQIVAVSTTDMRPVAMPAWIRNQLKQATEIV